LTVDRGEKQQKSEARIQEPGDRGQKTVGSRQEAEVRSKGIEHGAKSSGIEIPRHWG